MNTKGMSSEMDIKVKTKQLSVMMLKAKYIDEYGVHEHESQKVNITQIH